MNKIKQGIVFIVSLLVVLIVAVFVDSTIQATLGIFRLSELVLAAICAVGIVKQLNNEKRNEGNY